MPHYPKIHSDSQLKIIFVYDNLYTVIQEKLALLNSGMNYSKSANLRSPQTPNSGGFE